MRALLALFLLLACAPVFAQDEGGGGEAPIKADPVPEMTLDDARVNFRTVIESFLAANAPQGVWNLKDKRTKEIRRLSLFAIDEKSVRKAGEDGKYRGLVAFKEEGVDLPVQMEFTVDLGGDSWRVVRAKMLTKAARQ